MKFLKRIAQHLAARISRIWEKAKAVDYDTYLRNREVMEAREEARTRLMYYGRGGWL